MKNKAIGKKVPHVLSLKPGDIVAIPIRESIWAFGWIFRAATLGVFRCLRSTWEAPDAIATIPVALHVGFFCMPSQRQDFDWVYLGYQPFASSEEEWPPPQWSEDVVCPGQFHLHHKGKIVRANEQQIQGLGRHLMSSPGSIRRQIAEASSTWPFL